MPHKPDDRTLLIDADADAAPTEVVTEFRITQTKQALAPAEQRIARPGIPDIPDIYPGYPGILNSPDIPDSLPG
eukprot:15472520-Alexandrium_andersonii.AAC.1